MNFWVKIIQNSGFWRSKAVQILVSKLNWFKSQFLKVLSTFFKSKLVKFLFFCKKIQILSKFWSFIDFFIVKIGQIFGFYCLKNSIFVKILVFKPNLFKSQFFKVLSTLFTVNIGQIFGFYCLKNSIFVKILVFNPNLFKSQFFWSFIYFLKSKLVF